MEIIFGERYEIAVRLPWGELRRFATTLARREMDGGVVWSADGWEGPEPRLDCVIRECDGWIMGWLGGTCDTVVVLSNSPDAPLP